MQYGLVVTKGRNKELYKLYDNMESAERKLNKDFKTNGKIIRIPEIRAGLKIYKSGGKYWATIVRESKNIYFLNNTENIMYYDDCILKDNILKYFYMEIFEEGIESYDPDFEANVYIEDIPEDELKETDDNKDNNNEEIAEDSTEE